MLCREPMWILLWAVSGTPPDPFARASWVGLKDAERTDLYFSALAEGKLGQGIYCPKIRPAQFWYPKAGTYLRGAKALQTIEKGEEFCVVPTASLVSIYSVTNSTLGPALGRLENSLSHNISKAAPHSSSGPLSILGERMAVVLWIIREVILPCPSTPHMHGHLV